MKINSDKKLIYTAYSKFNFYLKDHISIYVLSQGYVPLNPFANWKYFMADTINRNVVRNANFTILNACSEIWVFGTISNGVVAEIDFALKKQLAIKYIDVSENGLSFEETSFDALKIEKDAFMAYPKLKNQLPFANFS